jgi:hypothetical protein
LLRAFAGKGSPSVNVHMRGGRIYENMHIEKLSDTAFSARSKEGPLYLIQYDEVKQIKCQEPDNPSS